MFKHKKTDEIRPVKKDEKKDKEKEDRKRAITTLPSNYKNPANEPVKTERSNSGTNLSNASPRSDFSSSNPASPKSMPSPSFGTSPGDNFSLERETSNPNVPAPPSFINDGLTKNYSAPLQDPAGMLKSKISALPADTKQLVEYLLNIFSRALPPGWNTPPNLEAISMESQIDTTIDKLIEASEILFNKDTNSLLKRYAKELRETPDRRTDKWRILVNLIGNESTEFHNAFLASTVLEAVIMSALARPLEDDEGEILSELLRSSLIKDIAYKELFAVVQTASQANAFVSQPLDDNRSLPDAITELVSSFKKLLSSPEGEVEVQELSSKKEAEVSESVTQSVALLQHANTIKQAKGGSDILHPLETFFKHQIADEVKQRERWQVTGEQAKAEKVTKLQEIDNFVKDEEGKLHVVQGEIADLETKLDQKRTEEKRLQESLEKKLAERELYQIQREHAESEIRAKIEETALHLEQHKKAEESVVKFSQDVSVILDREVNETLKKTKEVLQELDKEVSFLEEKMVTYERSISLFNAADEPEVLDGLKKLFSRSTAIYAESKQSISRVSGVVDLLGGVLAKGSAQVKELVSSLDKIVARQNALNNKYKLQKE